MILRFDRAIAFATMVGCASPSTAPPPTAPTRASAPSADALRFPTLRIDSKQRSFPEEILFPTNSSEPLALSLDALDRTAATMKAMPVVTLLAVMGHTETSESAEVADQRAARVIELLVARGVEPTRLEARPFTPAPAAQVGRCGMLSAAEREIEHKRELAAERSVHFAIARVDDP
jgi:outer membrane protein OmpA-like peptidoglycan-associated protein